MTACCPDGLLGSRIPSEITRQTCRKRHSPEIPQRQESYCITSSALWIFLLKEPCDISSHVHLVSDGASQLKLSISGYCILYSEKINPVKKRGTLQLLIPTQHGERSCNCNRNILFFQGRTVPIFTLQCCNVSCNNYRK